MFNPFGSRRNRRRTAPRNWTILPLESRVLLSAIQVISHLRNDGSVDLKIDGTTADDFISIVPDGAGHAQVFTANPDGFSLNHGTPQQVLTFAALHDLKVNLGAGNEGLFLSDVSANDVRITNGVSATDSGFYAFVSNSSNVTLGDVRIDVGKGNLVCNLDPLLALSFESFSINCTDTTSTRLIATTRGSGSITVEDGFSMKSSGASSSDTLEVAAVSFGPTGIGKIQIDGGLNLELGGGGDAVTFSGNISVAGVTRINTGADSDSVQFLTGDGATFNLDGNVRIETGKGADQVQLTSSGSSSRIVAEGHLTICTGDHNDSVTLTGVAVGKNLTVDTGASDSNPSGWYPNRVLDFVSLGNTEIWGKSVVQSRRLANVSIFAQNSLLQPARFHGPAYFILGSGSVDASFVPDPSSHVIFDGLQKYVGLNQKITVSYGTNVVFQANKRKLFNAILI